MDRAARIWHAITCVVAVGALILQTVLVVQGSQVLDESEIAPLGDRLIRLVSYFTIQSNVLIAVVAGLLAVDPTRDGRLFRVARLDGIAGITVTAVVVVLVLARLTDLQGWDAVADSLLHQIVPVLAVIGWLTVGPRPRVDGRTIALGLIWPLLWLGYTLVMGELRGWYPYPFVDAARLGYGQVALNCAVITALFLLLFGLLLLLDRRLPPRPRREREPARG